MSNIASTKEINLRGEAGLLRRANHENYSTLFSTNIQRFIEGYVHSFL
jgi:hypothetical protein